MKFKDCSAGCSNGSINLGIVKTSSMCCNSDQCNAQDAPDPSTGAPNGNRCYSCDEKGCSNELKCSGREDRCIKATGTFGGLKMTLKGCVSKSMCVAQPSGSALESISCCSGNLCNGAESVTQSFLILCFSLIAFILML
ncbi:urokinase plasminogen activator surface receptor-like [Danio aesculapii]|uniref:urokinase plasminogen activator surface receptor-like n=1 Tax=Danio aesculapii TaxID=1142201 RepID=UPI0024BF284D|nr:urokinase plasminogen activator surface receptor-like [Danio aesculapii]